MPTKVQKSLSMLRLFHPSGPVDYFVKTIIEALSQFRATLHLEGRINPSDSSFQYMFLEDLFIRNDLVFKTRFVTSIK
jgi:hypothetical protein